MVTHDVAVVNMDYLNPTIHEFHSVCMGKKIPKILPSSVVFLFVGTQYCPKIYTTYLKSAIQHCSDDGASAVI